ncbi:phage holin family protein [Enterococcus casseliflavus]|uniref:phage holin family protein n=1 Tax=Enterococcus casseliflavus TaxID=37734 RepID=UPI003D0B80BB
MDLKFLQEYLVPVIVVACLVVGYLIKTTPVFAAVANGYIPLIVIVLGAILGLIINGLTVEAIVYGAVSGIASTGMHQLFVQLLNLGSNDLENEYGDGQEFTTKTVYPKNDEEAKE